MQWEAVFGQETIKEQLRARIREDRIAHAQMFIGPTGYGSLALALAYARELILHNHPNRESAALKLDKMVHPDVHFVYPVNTTPSVSRNPVATDFIETWRNQISKNPYTSGFEWMQALGIEKKLGIINVHQSTEINKALALKSFENGYKVMIIWQAEKMNISAANKLLKLLEEPPEKTVFLLVAEQADSILPTIISRCQTLRVPPIKRDALSSALQSSQGLDPDRARTVARLAEGNFNEALHIIHSGETEEFNHSAFRDWMRMCYGKKYFDILKWVDQMAPVGRERQQNFLRYGLHIFRESIMSNYGTPELVHLEGEEKQFVDKFKPFVNSANSLKLTELFEEAIYHIERNLNPKVVFLDLSLHVMKQVRVKP